MTDLPTTEQRNPRTLCIDRCSTLELLQLINEEDALVVPAVASQLPQIAQAVDAITQRLAGGGRLFYVGAGTSGRLGVLDASECPPTFHTDPELVQGIIAGGETALRHPVENAEDDAAAGAALISAHGMGCRDVLVGVAASGSTPFVLGAVEAARSARLYTVGISCNEGSRLSKAAELAITPVVGPEVIQGSTRMKAGTAQKLVLNMLSTAAMIKLGKVYSNLMVDLSPSNAKLHQRARRIVAQAAEVEPNVAAAALLAAGGEVKTAIVTLLAGVTPGEARALLLRGRGRIAAALGEEGLA